MVVETKEELVVTDRDDVVIGDEVEVRDAVLRVEVVRDEDVLVCAIVVAVGRSGTPVVVGREIAVDAAAVAVTRELFRVLIEPVVIESVVKLR